jgi:16S rRNA (guanine527-N7)-methyltransferase
MLGRPWAAVYGRLEPILVTGRNEGFFGPGPLVTHLEVAASLATAWAAVAGERQPTRGLDLGTGGGMPGLALSLAWPTSEWVLLDSQARRCVFARAAVTSLALTDRVEVVQVRAEDAGRDEALRGAFELVSARGFGSPAVVAECSAPFLQVGGVVVVSDPAAAGQRWLDRELRRVGLEFAGSSPEGSARPWTALRQVAPCPDAYPRRVGIPAKRPLW